MRKALSILAIILFSVINVSLAGAYTVTTWSNDSAVANATGYTTTTYTYTVDKTSQNNSRYDYGDAPSYDVAKHDTDEWQMLGRGWSEEWRQRDTDIYDDGVFYSTDQGSTWNAWGNNVLNLEQGQTIRFGFEFTRALYGNHPYDDLGVWLDKDGNGIFEDSENILYGRWMKDTTQHIGSDSDYWLDGDRSTNRYDMETAFFSTEDITIGTSFAGDTWLRARVTCSESIDDTTGAYNPEGSNGFMSASGSLWQGETEDYRLNVSNVPIPGAVWLLGSGLAGLIGVRRRKKS